MSSACFVVALVCCRIIDLENVQAICKFVPYEELNFHRFRRLFVILTLLCQRNRGRRVGLGGWVGLGWAGLWFELMFVWIIFLNLHYRLVILILDLILGGTQTNNAARTNPSGDARPPPLGGLGSLPELDRMLGGVPDASMMTQLLQNPAVSQMMQSLLSNPQYMNQVSKWIMV